MAAAGEHLDAAQCGDEVFKVGEKLLRAGEGDNHVAVARDIERRDRYGRARESRHQLPVAVDIAIIIERTAEARALELAGVEIDVTLAEPRRQRGWRPGAPEKASVLRYHADVGRRPAACRGADGCSTLARCEVEHVAHGYPWIALQLGLSDAGLLEIQLVELGVRGARHDAGRARLAARPVRHAEASDGTKTVGAQARCLPGYGGAPVMTDDDGGRGH